MTPEERKEIFEWGELEREYTHLAEFTKHGGFMHRLMLWLAKQCRLNREAVKEKANKNG